MKSFIITVFIVFVFFGSCYLISTLFSFLESLYGPIIYLSIVGLAGFGVLWWVIADILKMRKH